MSTRDVFFGGICQFPTFVGYVRQLFNMCVVSLLDYHVMVYSSQIGQIMAMEHTQLGMDRIHHNPLHIPKSEH